MNVKIAYKKTSMHQKKKFGLLGNFEKGKKN